MAKSTFSWSSCIKQWFIQADLIMVDITAETTLTFNDHAGRIIEVNGADGAVTTINKVLS